MKNVHNIVLEDLYDKYYLDIVKSVFFMERLAPYMEPILFSDYGIPQCERNVKKVKSLMAIKFKIGFLLQKLYLRMDFDSF